jgi:iron complex outermembrane receptor protein
VNRADILFQATGGAQANVGFFDNVSDTRRRGVELEVAQQLGPVNWTVNYSLVDATFRDRFVVNSPNHPLFGAAADALGAELIVGAGKLLVEPGARLPGISRHQAGLTLDLQATGSLRFGADLAWRSGVFLRGDEINVLGKTADYAVFDLRADLRLSGVVSVFARVENVFDVDYETFGLLGEPDEVFINFENPRFFGAGPPRGAWLGLRLKL